MSTTTSPRTGFWNRTHYLNRMTLRELVVAYFQYPAIIAYLLLAALSIWVAVERPASTPAMIASVVAALIVYPVAWYFIHRYILHGTWMFRSRYTAALWKRIHYDHHQDPNHLEVLFGALYSTLPAVAATTGLAGFLIGGVGGAAAAFATGLLTTCVYEFVHCIQHLGFKPKQRWLLELKRRHMEHHFHDERGNYGIVSFGPDKLFGTLYERTDRPQKSKTVFNLGYTSEVSQRYPWVAKLSGGVASDHPRQRAAAD